jgi:pimeloyl-ACP methyl ester carboxylesterase
VIFVHGNQADAQNWLDVMSQFAAGAGYTMQEMYALSYNGLANYYAGAPEQLAPTALDTAYVGQNSSTLANGGHGSANDDNVPDLCRFVEAVQWYTGSRQVDLVGHSLGVTIIRRMMELYPSLARDVVAFVGVAGANHGTSVCTGQASTYYGCDEIAPGTPWLAQLNAYGETYAPTHWMTVYNGAEGDPFFIGPDVDSPHLAGADNRTFNTDGIHGDYHNDLRVDPPEVETYLSFLLRQGQAGPGAARGVEAQAQRLAADAAQREQSNQTVPSLYRLTVAPLCIPDLTGSEDGCALTVVSTFSAGEEIPAPGRGHRTAASSSGLPDTAATAPAPASPSLLASLALLGIASSAAATRRRRRSRS